MSLFELNREYMYSVRWSAIYVQSFVVSLQATTSGLALGIGDTGTLGHSVVMWVVYIQSVLCSICVLLIVSILRDMSTDSDYSGMEKEPARDLRHAVRKNDTDQVHGILDEAPGTINALGGSQWGGRCTALMEAARRGNCEVATVLIERGADVDKTNVEGRTALMDACCRGHVDMVKLLLDSGADPHIKASSGRDAIMVAAACRRRAVLDAMSARGLELPDPSTIG